MNTLVNFQSAQPSKTGQFSIGVNKRTVVATTKRVREWFWRENGKYNLAIKYGAKTLVLAKGGKNAIELANFAEVVATLQLVKTAVEQGELDDAIAEVSAATRKAFAK